MYLHECPPFVRPKPWARTEGVRRRGLDRFRSIPVNVHAIARYAVAAGELLLFKRSEEED